MLKRAARAIPGFPAARLRGLDPEPPQDRVSEVVRFASGDGGTGEMIGSTTTPWGWIAGGALATALALLFVASARRLQRRSVPG